MIELTTRETQSILLLSEGYAPKEAAEILGISVRTIEHHLSKARAALNARTTIQACVIYSKMNGQNQ